MDTALEFKATIVAGPRGGMFVEVPDPIIEQMGGGGRIPVAATFDGEAYRGSIVRMGGRPVLGIRKSIRETIDKGAGSSVLVTVRRDSHERSVEVPVALAQALAERPSLRAAFEGLSYTHRREYAEWIAEAKKEETRQRRVRRALQMIEEGRTR
jgi:hypothetical protein